MWLNYTETKKLVGLECLRDYMISENIPMGHWSTHEKTQDKSFLKTKKGDNKKLALNLRKRINKKIQAGDENEIDKFIMVSVNHIPSLLLQENDCDARKVIRIYEHKTSPDGIMYRVMYPDKFKIWQPKAKVMLNSVSTLVQLYNELNGLVHIETGNSVAEITKLPDEANEISNNVDDELSFCSLEPSDYGVNPFQLDSEEETEKMVSLLKK